MEDKVIRDIMNDDFLPQGRYPENFVMISLLEVCQEGEGSGRGVLGGRWGLLNGDIKDRVILTSDIRNEHFLHVSDQKPPMSSKYRP